METSSFLKALNNQRPTYQVELQFDLDDGRPAVVECQDLSPKDWWRIPDSKGLPVIVGRLQDLDNWTDEDKTRYWEYLTHICKFAVQRIREVQETEDGYNEQWLEVQWVDDEAQSGIEGRVLKLTIEQFDRSDNVSRVGQRVLFRGQLRRADGVSRKRRTQPKRTDRVRKARKASGAAAARAVGGAA